MSSFNFPPELCASQSDDFGENRSSKMVSADPTAGTIREIHEEHHRRRVPTGRRNACPNRIRPMLPASGSTHAETGADVAAANGPTDDVAAEGRQAEQAPPHRPAPKHRRRTTEPPLA